MSMRASRVYISFIELTDSTKHRPYNEWHQLDHRPENINLPGIVHGERFVLTPECLSVSSIGEPLIHPFHYLLMYWLEEPMDRTWREFTSFSSNSTAMGRRPELTYVKRRMTGMFCPLKGYAAPRVLISPEAVPYRPARGIFIHAADVGNMDGIEIQEMLHWYDQVHIPDMLACPGVAGAWTFVNDPAYTFSNSIIPHQPGRIVQVYYLDEDPLFVLAEIGKCKKQWLRAGRWKDTSETKKDLFSGPLQVIYPWQWDWFDKVS